jgi:predicted acyltransferase
MADQPAPARSESAGRIASMDQFRGYCVAGMFVVNFLAGFKAIHPVWKHNDTFFSYADSIMPAFLFAAGFAFRLTILRRITRDGQPAAYRHAIVRSVILMLITLLLFGITSAANTWREMTGPTVREFLARLFKAELWNVLAIIGAVQILCLPVAAASGKIRILTIAIFLAMHAALSDSFNYEFVYGRPNWLDAYWGAAGTRAWDGGFFGLLMWSVPLLAGTLAYDTVSAVSPRIHAVRRLLLIGLLWMISGYALSCLARLYEPAAHQSTAPTSSVLPPIERLSSHSLTALLADPPFVVPPPSDIRPLSYWTMNKRIVTPSFILFGTGLAFALYAGFVLVCDQQGRRSQTLRMLGQNALVAYILHYPIKQSIHAVMPNDSPWWWCLLGLALFLAIMLSIVRYLDRHRLYVHL